MNTLRRALTTALALVLFAIASHAQLPTPPTTTEDALRQMLDEAGIVFTGQVTAIRRVASANGSTGATEIDFAIDDAILGVAPNTTYTLREWAGLASAGTSPFLVGRRYLMFLHAPGPSGLTSPVNGPDGAIPVLPTAAPASPDTPDAAGLAAQAALTESSTTQHSPAHNSLRIPSTSSSDALAAASLGSSAIDLRWIATRVLTPLAYASAGPAAAHPIVTRANLASPVSADSSQSLISTNTAPRANPPVITPIPAATQTASYATVLNLLQSWQRESRAAR